MRERGFPTAAGRDAWRNPHFDQCVAEQVGIMAPVCKQRPGLTDEGMEHPRPDVVRRLVR
jgi:hypothetical protein